MVLYHLVFCSCWYWIMYAEVRSTPCKLHKKQIMRGLHCVTLQTRKQRFVSISKAALPSGGESLNVQWKDSEAVLSSFSNKSAILLITFCQGCPQTLHAKFSANRSNCLGGVWKSFSFFAILRIETKLKQNLAWPTSHNSAEFREYVDMRFKNVPVTCQKCFCVDNSVTLW